MSSNPKHPFRPDPSRRDFIKQTATATALVAAAKLMPPAARAASATPTVALVLDREDALLKSPPVQWAAEQLRETLQARGVNVRTFTRIDDAPAGTDCILIGSGGSAVVRAALAASGATLPNAAESLALVRGRVANRAVLLVSGADVRGLVYAALEVADRAAYASDPTAAWRSIDRVVEQPANPIRSVARLFSSDVEDKGWFYDREFWRRYLSMLVAQRFNRFSLTLGLGYNAPRNVPDSYFYFAYPFLLAVPGYEVSARGLPDAERDRNLAMLRWIGEETTARGLHFQLGLWTQAYEFINSPDVNYPIVGLTPQTHGPYCRDALQRLLEACPAIQGVTFRCHSESGIPQGSYEFWPLIFEGVARCGRRVEIDIHSKGIEHSLLAMALKTGLPVNVSPKYWAEHMGLPYHQTAIQKGEKFRAVPGKTATIEQARRFTRYGYADYLREDRRYGVLYRMWPGTQRFLLWGDPAMAAGYGRLAHFCGSLGLELCEPLSFKGRIGSGRAGDRNGYADARLRPAGGDWEKHLITYRQWGRLLYNPDTDASGWRRFLTAELGAAASDAEAALANASRILPLVTTAHLPSASNNSYWPEIYTNIPIVGNHFAAVDGIDPGLFSSINDFADELARGPRRPRYSPLEVAAWLETLANRADTHLAAARARAAAPASPALQRLAIDVSIQSGTGRFLAQKLRAGVAYALHQRTKSPALLGRAIEHYRAARDTWVKMVAVSRDAYQSDLTYGRAAVLRGHWADRLPAIESDLAAMEKAAAATATGIRAADAMVRAFEAELGLAAKPVSRPRVEHVPATSFQRGRPLEIALTIGATAAIAGARLHYRHVNQAEEMHVVDFAREGNTFRQTVPGDYTDSSYPLMYLFELRGTDGRAWFSPGLAPDLSNQPYFVVRERTPMRTAAVRGG